MTDAIREVLVAPLPLLLTQTAAAVAEAQITLDEAAIHTQGRIDELTRQAQADTGPDDEPTGLARFQVEAPWYHFQQVDVELKLSLSLAVREQDRGGGKRVFHPAINAIPYNSRARSLTNLDAEGTSRLTARVVPVPPPSRPS